MIKSISIRNIALIENLEIEFFDGLNIITGETGAGKSVLLSSIGLILGGKAHSGLIRTGEQKGVVEVVFDISNNQKLKKILQESGIEIEENTLIVKREVTEESRSRSFVNLNSVPNSSLKIFGEHLLDISGQHEYQSLLRPQTHIELLDNFANLKALRTQFSNNYLELQKLKVELNKLTSDEEKKEEILQLNRYSSEEIDKSNLKMDEDNLLEKELEALNNFEKLNSSLEIAYDHLYLQDHSIISSTEKVLAELEKIIQFDPKIDKSCNDLREGLYTFENVRDVLRSYKEDLDYSPERVEVINQRLELINDLKRKYGTTIPDVLSHKDKCEKEIETYSHNQELIESLTKQIKQGEKDVEKRVIDLSKARQKSAKLLEKEIEQELAFLGMEKASFKVEFRYIQNEESFIKISGKGVKIDENQGIDRVEFIFSANSGEIPRPLIKIASGGELSRVMLAIKSILTEMDEINTLLFDEVDAGIGGEMAVKVGHKIKAISQKRQVLCITHSPQIASQSNDHYLVEKFEENKRTKTLIRKLNQEEKVKEIARMLGGEKITELSIQHARELIGKN